MTFPESLSFILQYHFGDVAMHSCLTACPFVGTNLQISSGEGKVVNHAHFDPLGTRWNNPQISQQDFPFCFQVPDDTASSVNSSYKLWAWCVSFGSFSFFWIATWRPPVSFATCFHPSINTPLWHPRGRNRCQVQSKTFCSLCCIPANFSWAPLNLPMLLRG